MKHIRCLIAFILLFALFLPTQVMAAEVTTYTEDVIYLTLKTEATSLWN